MHCIRKEKNDNKYYDDMNFDNNHFLKEYKLYTYQTGLRQFCNCSFEDLLDIMNRLGYSKYEYYISCHSEGGVRLADPIYASFICAWELFSNDLICVFRKDDKIMSQDVLRISNYNSDDISSFGIKRELETFSCLVDSLKDRLGIRNEFIMKLFSCSNPEDESKTKPYSFSFDRNGILKSAKVFGYDIRAINDFSYDVISAYHKYANKYCNLDSKTLIALINYQYECYSHIDGEIVISEGRTGKFSYTEETYCDNYIAMAAFYKQYDVELKYFLLSMDGQYEIVSETTTNGTTVTKVKAYNELFKFIDGHSMSGSNIGFNGESRDLCKGEKSGFVYVMINPSIEGMVKIGMTTRDPNERVKELSAPTGVPTPFILVYYKQFSDCHLAEEVIHKRLKDRGYRVNDNREFFKMSPTDAIRVIQDYYDEVEC